MNTSIFCKWHIFLEKKYLYLYLLFSIPTLNAATLKTSLDFESGVLKNIACSGNCPQDYTEPKKKSHKRHSAKFTITPQMPTRYRTEAVLTKHGDFDLGKEYWIGFDYFYNNWGKDRAGEVAPFQIHGKPSSWDAACGKFRYAPFHMESSNDQVIFMTYGVKEMWKGPIEKNQWLNIIIHFKLSAGHDGFIEAWKNGVKLGRTDGQNEQILDSCGKPNRSAFLKIGIYKFPWRNRPKSDVTRRELFIDNLKIAEGKNGFSLVGKTRIIDTPNTSK